MFLGVWLECIGTRGREGDSLPSVVMQAKVGNNNSISYLVLLKICAYISIRKPFVIDDM